MLEYLEIVKKSKLFLGIDDRELENLFKCLKVEVKDYNKNEYIIESGKENKNIVLILKGKVYLINEDYWGNRNIILEGKEGEIFGEANACRGQKPSTNLIAVQNTKVMLINFSRIINICPLSLTLRETLIKNLLEILSKNNIELTLKIGHMSRRTTREKLLSYLSERANFLGKTEFEIPFDRQQLADYLCIDRSAMSKELSKLKKDGILDYKKEWFRLLKEEK